MEGFGERLRELRGCKSQASFARELGLSQVVYGRYELNQREPNLDTLCHIGLTLGISADWLLGLPERGGTARVTAGDGAAVAIGGTATASNCRDCPILLDFIKRRSGGG
ncbi:MAG: helix-turn-helix transcriptional regulator [Kiritimatiellae bacterium]|nr:helix-turn-helix transcriptional regulator [Kiritimatiellia bacterium]